MRPLLEDVHETLSALPLRVTRAWPQGLVALPSAAIRLLEERVAPDGARQETVEIILRAGSPEMADHLAALAAAALQPPPCHFKDGSEKDGSCFLKTLRVERLRPAPWEEECTLTLAGQSHPARLAAREAERALTDITTLQDTAPRLLAGRVGARTLRLRLPPAAMADAEAAMMGGETLTTPWGSALIAGYALKGGSIELRLCISL